MDIKVTEEDVKQGKRWNPRESPIALACRREFPDTPVEVHSVAIRLGEDSWETSGPIRNWLHQFDNGVPVTPIVIQLHDLDNHWHFRGWAHLTPEDEVTEDG
jgi:hypothetical protein